MATTTVLYMDQGATFTANVTVNQSDGTGFDLTHYSARSKIRKHHSSSNSYSFTTTVNVETSIITLDMNAASTSNITDGRYLFDVEIYDANTNVVYRVAEGLLVVTPEITK